MITPKRIDLIPASGISSSYKKRYKPKQRLDISKFNTGGQRGNMICPDMFEALKELSSVVHNHKGQFYIIDLFRSWDTQATARKAYETGRKRAYVAKPGGSFHTSGRAVDISVKELNFEGISKDDWLQFFWDLAIPLGFRPIIKIPDLRAMEAWHFDFLGKAWSTAYDKLTYPEIAKCAILDVGEWNPVEKEDKIQKMFVQSQLIRLGHHGIGKVDGIFGIKTNNALALVGLGGLDAVSQGNTLARYQ